MPAKSSACADPLQYAQRGFEVSQMTSELWQSTRFSNGQPLGNQELNIRGFSNHFWCVLGPGSCTLLDGGMQQHCISCLASPNVLQLSGSTTHLAPAAGRP